MRGRKFERTGLSSFDCSRQHRRQRASRDRLRKMAGVVFTGDLLGPGEMPNSHLVRVENLMGSDNTGRSEFPAGHPTAGAFDVIHPIIVTSTKNTSLQTQ